MFRRVYLLFCAAVTISLSVVCGIEAVGTRDQMCFYQDAFRLSPTPTVIIDNKFHILDISETYLDILSISKIECLQRNFVDLTRERLEIAEAENLIVAVKAALTERASQYIEIKDPRRHHFWHIHVKPWTDASHLRDTKVNIRSLVDCFSSGRQRQNHDSTE